MKKQFAFILMGKDFDANHNTATIESPTMICHFLTVNSMDEAVQRAADCAQKGVGAIELCGFFGKEGAEAIIEATGNKVAVGYVTNDPSQDRLFAAFFTGA